MINVSDEIELMILFVVFVLLCILKMGMIWSLALCTDDNITAVTRWTLFKVTNIKNKIMAIGATILNN